MYSYLVSRSAIVTAFFSPRGIRFLSHRLDKRALAAGAEASTSFLGARHDVEEFR